MAQNGHVPKFGNWDDGEDIPYTQYFDTAVVDKSGRTIINPNDPYVNPSAFPGRELPVHVQRPMRSKLDLSAQRPEQCKSRDHAVQRQSSDSFLWHEASSEQQNQDGKTTSTTGVSSNRSSSHPSRRHRHQEKPGYDFHEENPGYEGRRSVHHRRRQEKQGYSPPSSETGGRGGKKSPPPTTWEKRISTDEKLNLSLAKPGRMRRPRPASRTLEGWNDINPRPTAAAAAAAAADTTTDDSGYGHVFSKTKETNDPSRPADRPPFRNKVLGRQRRKFSTCFCFAPRAKPT